METTAVLHPLFKKMAALPCHNNLRKAIARSKELMSRALVSEVFTDEDAVLAFGIVVTNNENGIARQSSFEEVLKDIKAWKETWASNKLMTFYKKLNA